MRSRRSAKAGRATALAIEGTTGASESYLRTTGTIVGRDIGSQTITREALLAVTRTMISDGPTLELCCYAEQENLPPLAAMSSGTATAAH